MGAGHVHRTDDIHLVIFERYIPFIHIDYVIGIVYPESETTTKIIKLIINTSKYIIHMCLIWTIKNSM